MGVSRGAWSQGSPKGADVTSVRGAGPAGSNRAPPGREGATSEASAAMAALPRNNLREQLQRHSASGAPGPRAAPRPRPA